MCCEDFTDKFSVWDEYWVCWGSSFSFLYCFVFCFVLFLLLWFSFLFISLVCLALFSFFVGFICLLIFVCYGSCEPKGVRFYFYLMVIFFYLSFHRSVSSKYCKTITFIFIAIKVIQAPWYCKLTTSLSSFCPLQTQPLQLSHPEPNTRVSLRVALWHHLSLANITGWPGIHSMAAHLYLSSFSHSVCLWSRHPG